MALRLMGLESKIEKDKDANGFNMIANALGVKYPDRPIKAVKHNCRIGGGKRNYKEVGKNRSRSSITIL